MHSAQCKHRVSTRVPDKRAEQRVRQLLGRHMAPALFSTDRMQTILTSAIQMQINYIDERNYVRSNSVT